MKSGAKFSRKHFLKTLFWAGLMLPLFQYCEKKVKGILLKITGTNSVLGHQLWAKNFPKPEEEIRTKFLIVGAGISGLSACRYLKQNGEEDFLLLEMENHLGGNSSSGENKYSKFPLGAHYLPLPNKEDSELITFLKECKLYLGDDEKGLPVLDEEQLSFPEQERLFYKNSWQTELIPQKGIAESVRLEIKRFLETMQRFRTKKDKTGKYWFTIPIAASSTEDEVLNLEKMTFEKWLQENDFKSKELLWYLDYSCRDDYGLGIQYVSAWAGIHYFAGRKNNWATHKKDQVFTWPEGNARLAKHLSIFSKDKFLTKHLVFEVIENVNSVEVYAFDNSEKKSKKIIAEKVLFATPQFVNQHVFKNRKFKNFNYVPWLLTTITLQDEFGGDEELAWDNVIYDSEGLGYIYDQHQNLNQVTGEKVITYYRSFSSENCRKARKQLYNMKEDELKSLVINDLKKAHPLIEDYIIEMQFHKIGHAMIAPVPNQIFGKETVEARKSINERIFFAHTDLSGISIFEEAFHQGISAAKQMLS